MIMKVHQVNRPIRAHLIFYSPAGNVCAGDVESVQPSVIQTIVDTAAQVETIQNSSPSPVIGQVSPTVPRIQPAYQSFPDELIIDEEEM